MRFFKDRPITLTILGTMIFVLVVLLYGDKIYGSSFIQDFGSNWLSTLLGVVIGIPVALWINRWVETRTETERKNKILSLLKNELIFNLDLIKIREDKGLDKDNINAIIYYASDIKDETYKSFSDGGELEWIKDLELLEGISYAYYSIRVVRYRANLYLELSKSPRSSDYEESLFRVVREGFLKSQELLSGILPDAISAIDTQLNEKK